METHMNNLSPIIQSLLSIFTNVFAKLMAPIFDDMATKVVELITSKFEAFFLLEPWSIVLK